MPAGCDTRTAALQVRHGLSGAVAASERRGAGRPLLRGGDARAYRGTVHWLGAHSQPQAGRAPPQTTRRTGPAAAGGKTKDGMLDLLAIRAEPPDGCSRVRRAPEEESRTLAASWGLGCRSEMIVWLCASLIATRTALEASQRYPADCHVGLCRSEPPFVLSGSSVHFHSPIRPRIS